MNKIKKSKFIRFMSKIGIFIVLGAIIGFIVGKIFSDFIAEYIVGDNFFIGILRIYGILALFLVLYLAHVIVHEAGHLIFGLLTGYSFVSFRIGSLTLIKENGKLKRKKLSIPGTAGQCLLAPPPIVNGIFKYKLYNYGGALMNLVTSAIAIGLILLLPNMPIALDISLGCFASGGILLGLTNAIPMKIAGVANDGLNVKSMKKDELGRKSFYLQLDINAKQSLGMRMREMPAEWFILPEDADLSNVLVSSVKLLEYYRHIDLMDFVAAWECLEQFKPIINKLPGMYRNFVYAEQLFLELIHDCRISYIEQILTREVKTLLKAAKNEINIKRIAYTYQARYVKDSAATEKCYQEALKLANNYPVRAEATTNMMLIEYVKNLSDTFTVQSNQ